MPADFGSARARDHDGPPHPGPADLDTARSARASALPSCTNPPARTASAGRAPDPPYLRRWRRLGAGPPSRPDRHLLHPRHPGVRLAKHHGRLHGRATHRDLFHELRGARQSGATREPNRALREKLWELHKLADPLLRPTLLEQIAPLLTDENETGVREIVNEYIADFAPHDSARRESDGQRIRARDQDPARARERSATGLLLRETARTLASFFESRREGTELLRALIQTDNPEQETKIRESIQRLGDGKGTSPTPEARGQIMAEIQSLLTSEQRERLRRGRQDGAR